jgi:hypothetical protein
VIPYRDKRNSPRSGPSLPGIESSGNPYGIPPHEHTGPSNGGKLPEEALEIGELLVRKGASATLLDLIVRSLTIENGVLTLDTTDPRILTGLNQFGYLDGSQECEHWLMEDPDVTLGVQVQLTGPDYDGKVTLSGQTGSISAATLAPNAAMRGMFLVLVIHTCTSAGSAGTLATTIRWTDANGAQSAKPAADILLTGSATAFGLLLLDNVSNVNDITFETALTGGAGDPEYRLLIRTVPLG